MSGFKSIIFIAFCCSLLISCASQKKSVEKTSSASFDIQVVSSFVEIDNLGRVYIVDNKNRIINFKPDYKEQYRYANKRSGEITSIDVTNPLKVVVFCDDFNQVRFLDNTLSVISELNLSSFFADVSACASSNDGNIWIYDPTQFKLMKVTSQGNVLLETTNVNDFGMTNVKISDIRERGNYVVLCDRNHGFYFFDNLGQYIYSYEASDIKSFQFDGRNVIYYTPTGLKSYSVKFKERQMIAYPLGMNKEGLKYILYNAGDFYEVNMNGINVVKKVN